MTIIVKVEFCKFDPAGRKMQWQTYVEETYQTMLNHKTVLVESTDCSDDDDDDIATYYRMPVVCLPHNPQVTHPYLYCLRLEK